MKTCGECRFWEYEKSVGPTRLGYCRGPIPTIVTDDDPHGMVTAGADTPPCPTFAIRGDWTPAERAGLKAMGKYIGSTDLMFLNIWLPLNFKRMLAATMVRLFVHAARAVKERRG